VFFLVWYVLPANLILLARLSVRLSVRSSNLWITVKTAERIVVNFITNYTNTGPVFLKQIYLQNYDRFRQIAHQPCLT